nr:hypothetical protein [Tanacetum cinerariifolium]
MAASSSTAPFSLDLYHDGYFKLKPLTYIDSETITMNIDVTGFKFEDMKEYVETKTHSVVTSNEDIMAQLYVDHRNADLGEYIGKDLGDNMLVELKPDYDFDDSDDECSDVASLDHLSKGEEELREVRIKKSVEEKNKSNEDAYVDDKSRIVLHNKDVYDESRLVLHNDSDDNDHEFEVRQGNGIEAFCVDLEKRKCSCRQWQLTGVPCLHSITTMYFINTNLDDYVSESFNVSTYKSIYAFNILPVGSMNMWRKIKHVPCKPPLERRMPGRPPVNRKKDKSEMNNHKHVTRPPRLMTCKNYGETGHNKKGCEKPKVPGEQANPPNEQANAPSQQANPLKHKGKPMVNDPVNARVPSQSKDKFVIARGGIWMGGTSASGSNRGRGSVSGSNSGRGSASDPCTWSIAYFKEGIDCDVVENGLSESFNSHIKDARRKPIIGMLEDIRSYVMTRNYTLRKECKDWKSDIYPNIRRFWSCIKKIQSLSPSGWHQFEVRQGNGIEAFCVDLEKRKCSCRQWQLTGVPCLHSITTMYFINTNLDDYVSESFNVSTYKSIYAFNILPVGSMNMWRKIKHVPCKPPLERRMPGRPPVNRKKDKSEMNNHKHVTRPPRLMTCKNYGETGHNKKGCEKPKVPGEQANPPNEQANAPSQQANPLKHKGKPMVNDPVNARVPSQSKDKFVIARGGIWMGGTSASGSNRGRGSVSGSNSGRGSASGSNRGMGSASASNKGRGSASGTNMGKGRGRASGSNKVLLKKAVVDKYILLYEDDLVDVQVEEEVDTRAENVAVADAYENVAAEQDENQDEASRRKRNYEEFWESQYKAGYKKPRRSG